MLNVQKVREKRLPFLVMRRLEVLLVTLAKEMTPVEQKQFTSLLLREGIIGLLLQRLGIRDSK